MRRFHVRFGSVFQIIFAAAIALSVLPTPDPINDIVLSGSVSDARASQKDGPPKPAPVDPATAKQHDQLVAINRIEKSAAADADYFAGHIY